MAKPEIQWGREAMKDREIVERLRKMVEIPTHIENVIIERPPTPEAYAAANAIERLIKERDEALEALREAVFIIDKAGLSNLVNGVQLGQTSWFVKATERFDYARSILSKHEAKNDSN